MTAPFTLRDHNRNLFLNTLHEIFWGFGVAFHSMEAVIPLFLAGLNAPKIVVGSVAGVFTIGIAIPQIFSAFYGTRIRNLKLTTILIHLLLIPPIFTAGFVFAFMGPHGSNAWILYYVCYILFTLSVGILLPIWVDFLETVHLAERRGSFFGISFAGTSVAGFAGGLVVNRLIDKPDPIPYIGLGFLIYAACILTAVLLFILYRSRSRPASKRAHSFAQFTTILKGIMKADHNFRNYILSRIILTANYAAIPLYAVHAQDKLHFHISEAGIFTALMVVASGLFSFLAGRIGDRFGHKHAMVIAFLAYLGALISALLAETLFHVYLIFIFMGIGKGGFLTSAMSLVYEFAGDNDKKIYFALIDSLTAPFVLIAILLSGLFISTGTIPPVLTIIGIFLVAGILALIFLTKEPRTLREVPIPMEPLP